LFSGHDAKLQVLKLEREWTAAEIKRDAATLRHILDDRFVVTFGAGEAIDKEGFIKPRAFAGQLLQDEIS